MTEYDAFISYSHAKDRHVAADLQSIIQRLGKAWYRRRVLRVFRDDTSLSAAPGLWPSIEQALDGSRFLVLFASPEAAHSHWVGKEIARWLEKKTADTILIALTAGELVWDNKLGDFDWSDETPLPKELRSRFTNEPRWVDLRELRDSDGKQRGKLLEAAADLASAIRGVPKEDLLSQELQQQRRALLLASSAIALLLVLASAATWQWRTAVAQRNRAEATLLAATRGADDFVVDVAEKLRENAGLPLLVVRALLEAPEKMLKSLHEYNASSPDLIRSQARVLRETSQTLLKAGDRTQALVAAEQSLALIKPLLPGKPRDLNLLDELSKSHNRIGEAMKSDSRHAEALESFREALEIRERITEQDKRPETREALALSYERVADELLASDVDGAADLYAKDYTIREELAKVEPENPDRQENLAIVDERLAFVELRRDKDPLPRYRKALEIREKLSSSEPTNVRYLVGLGNTYDSIGTVLAQAGCSDEALESLRKGLDVRRRLVEKVPDRADWQAPLAKSLYRLAKCDDRAAENFAAANEILRRLDREGKLPEESRPMWEEIQEATGR